MVCSGQQSPSQSADSNDTTPCQGNGGCGGGGHCHNQDRRGFLKLLVGGVAVFWAGLTTVPFVRYLVSGKEESAGSEVSQVTVGPESDFPPGSSKNFQFGNIPALLVRSDAGEFTAFSAVCTHLGCTVQYSKPDKNIFCACHGGQFNPKTGENIAGPPPKPLTPLVAQVTEGVVIVSRA